ncbi:MAG: AAA family ATPase [Ruminococcus sp.]|nr:AAA family ATPase [Ruminococcus sp.]MCM1380965.1 AAA family ATPase [Muribaculaceae bacterium]MCM1478628.1 AAA family ATPase [Muribaculaceae bacterium]
MENLLQLIENFPKGERLIVGIDGRCAAGKTTLARRLQEEIGCAVFHMDDFFLRPEQRTAERLAEPGGNADRERFLAEVLQPLKRGRDVISYRPYDCKTQTFGEKISVKAAAVNVVEGAYCLHPDLWDFYGIRAFLTVSPDERLRRITRREGREKAKIFQEKWIPLEEKYFAAFDVEGRCDIRISTY